MNLNWKKIILWWVGLTIVWAIAFAVAVTFTVNSWVTNETSTEIDRTKETQESQSVEDELQKALN